MKNWKIIILSSALLIPLHASASPFGNWGGSNFGGSKWGGSNWGSDECNDWPEWTPMYWAEEMMGDDDCYSGYSQQRYPPQGAGYRSPYGAGAVPYLPPPAQATYRPAPQTVYQNPYPATYMPSYAASQPPVYGYPSSYSSYPRVNPALSRPYSGYNYPYNPRHAGYNGANRANIRSPYSPYSTPYAQGRRYSANRYPANNRYRNNRYRNNRYSRGTFPSWGRSGGFPGMNNFGSGSNPMGGNFGMPFSGGQGMNPMGNSFSMPMSGGMSPMGFGSPMSSMSNPMNPINPIGMGSGFGSPFGTGMTPFSGGRSPFTF